MLQERVWAPGGMQISNQSHQGWLMTDDETNIQEISNRTHWTDPEKTWVSNSSSNLLRGPLVRSHSILMENINKPEWWKNDQSTLMSQPLQIEMYFINFSTYFRTSQSQAVAAIHVDPFYRPPSLVDQFRYAFCSFHIYREKGHKSIQIICQ